MIMLRWNVEGEVVDGLVWDGMDESMGGTMGPFKARGDLESFLNVKELLKIEQTPAAH